MLVGKTMVLAAALAATGFVRAVEVGDCIDIQSINTESTPEVTYTAKTTKAAGTDLPDGIPTPIFWLDCANTNGWLFSGSTVTGIPSRVGSRSL